MPPLRRRPRSFVPALHADWLTRCYDRWVRLLIPEEALKQKLIDQARIEPGMSVLYLGCGTGTLVLLLKHSHPDVRVVGLDIDPKILEIARKITAAGADIELHHGRIEDADTHGSFDRVLSSFVLLHLTTEEKVSVLRAARQALRPGGELHVADLGPPRNPHVQRLLARLGSIPAGDRIVANVSGRIPDLLREAGFAGTEETYRTRSAVGTLVYYRATA